MACPSSEDQWSSYFHHQNPDLQSSFININCYDSAMMTTDSVITTSSSDMVMSPSHSSSPGARAPFSAASPKPIRRRSRASRKTPTTLLNADATNFRALVQQFTGKPSAPQVITPGVQRGPLNINFGQGSFSAEDQGFGSDSRFMPFGSGYDHHGYGSSSQQPLLYEQQRQSYGRVIQNPNPDAEFSDTFVGDGHLNIDDLDWGAISSSTHGSDSHHFM